MRALARTAALTLGVAGSLALLPASQAAAATCEALPTTTLTRTLSVAGEVDCYTTTSTISRKVRTRVARQSGTAATLHKPLLQKWVRSDGSTVCPTATDSPLWCTLPPGSYELRVRDSVRTAPATYTLGVFTPQTSCSSTGWSSAVSVTIGLGQTKCVSMAGSSLRHHLEALTTTSFKAATEVIYANGDPACPRTREIDFVCTSTRAGGIKLLIESASGRGKATVGITAISLHYSCGYKIPTDGSLRDDAGHIRNFAQLRVLGGVNCHIFDAAAGATYDVVTQPKPGRNKLRTQVVAPDGSVVCGPVTTKTLTCTTPTTGVYAIHTSAAPTTPYGPNYGSYTVTVKQQPGV